MRGVKIYFGRAFLLGAAIALVYVWAAVTATIMTGNDFEWMMNTLFWGMK